jgi:thiol-disulfide isomerase/thioredoxin
MKRSAVPFAAILAVAALVFVLVYGVAAKSDDKTLDEAVKKNEAPTAPSRTLPVLGTDGEQKALADYKGKVVFVNFWATWCGPCKYEIPMFVDLQQRYGPQGLQIVGISVDDPVDKLAPYVKEMGMNYPVLQGLGHEDVQDAYGPILGIPVSVMISRDGKVCATHTGLTSKDVFEREIQALL